MEIKIEYDNKGRIVGMKSVTKVEGEATEFEEKEFEFISKLISKSIENNHQENMENAKQIAATGSRIARDVCLSIASRSFDTNNQQRFIENTYRCDYDSSFDDLDLSPNVISKDEKPFDPDKRIEKSVK